MRMGIKTRMMQETNRLLAADEEGGMEIPVKAKVECADGPGGEATHVIVHPATKRVTRLVVKERRSPHAERLVPLRYVEDATADQIRLRCSQQELSKMQTFLRTELIETTLWYGGHASTDFKKVKRENIAEDELTLDTDTRVRAADGNMGRINELMVDPESGSITHLMMQEGHVWAPNGMTVPISEVERITEKVVYLKMNRAFIEALPTTAARRR
jgi:hypothetical protein